MAIVKRSSKRLLAEGFGLATVIVLIIITAGWLAGLIQQNAVYSFDSDEGIHAYEALRLSAHLRDGDLAGALTASTFSWFYPPAHPWLLGTVLTVLDATRAVVRLFNLGIYALDTLLLYALGRWLTRDTHYPWLAGVVATLLMLIAPPMWIMASLIYLELLGVLFILLAFGGYWQGVDGHEWCWFVTGLGIVAAGLTKYVYWLFLIVPLSLALVIHSCSASCWRAFPKRFALMLLPSLAVGLVWAMWPMMRSGLTSFIIAQFDLVERMGPSPLEHFIFYLRSILIQFSPSPLIAVGLAAAFVASLLRWRDNQLRPVAIFFAWHLVGISIHGGLRPRFLATAMPALWLMGGVWVARVANAWPDWIARLRTDGGKWVAQLAVLATIAALIATAALGLRWRVTVYPVLYMAELETDPCATDLYEWAAARIPAGGALVGLVNDWDTMSGPALGWELTTHHTTTPHRADLVTVWEMHRLPDPAPENVAALRAQMNARGMTYLVVYTAPGMGRKRLQGTLAHMGDKIRVLGEREFPLRWYWPDEIKRRLYNNEYLDDDQLQQAVDRAGLDRSLTVHIYAYVP